MASAFVAANLRGCGTSSSGDDDARVSSALISFCPIMPNSAFTASFSSASLEAESLNRWSRASPAGLTAIALREGALPLRQEGARNGGVGWVGWRTGNRGEVPVWW